MHHLCASAGSSVCFGLMLFVVLYVGRRVWNRMSSTDDDEEPLGWEFDKTDRRYVNISIFATVVALVFCAMYKRNHSCGEASMSEVWMVSETNPELVFGRPSRAPLITSTKFQPTTPVTSTDYTATTEPGGRLLLTPMQTPPFNSGENIPLMSQLPPGAGYPGYY